jgi:hypothetical protein
MQIKHRSIEEIISSGAASFRQVHELPGPTSYRLEVHDYLHYLLGLDTSLEGELKLADIEAILDGCEWKIAGDIAAVQHDVDCIPDVIKEIWKSKCI